MTEGVAPEVYVYLRISIYYFLVDRRLIMCPASLHLDDSVYPLPIDTAVQRRYCSLSIVQY